VSEPVVETASKVPPAEAKLSSDDISAKMEALKAQREAATKNLGFGDDPEAGVNLKKPDTTTKLVAADLDEKRGEVTASTLGKLMGLATSNEMRLMEGKVDLLSTRVNAIIMKLEKMALLIQDTPSSSDLDRIDVQLASLRTLIKDVVDGSLQKALEAERQKAQQRLDEQAKEVKKTGSSIVSNNPNSPSQ
ncbi:MAG: hypothetical protein KDD62_13765, partial [Bdellovibrionales bacterium]|nr:hypothetical protein [Bdellovibrionales bacterium]